MPNWPGRQKQILPTDHPDEETDRPTGKIPPKIPRARRPPMLAAVAEEMEEEGANKFQRAWAMRFAKGWPVVASNKRI